MEKMLTLSPAQTQIQCPFRLLIAGGTGTGKSFFIQKIISPKQISKQFNVTFKRIIYSHPFEVTESDQKYLDTLKELCPMIEIVSGIPDFKEIAVSLGHKLVILDDQILKIVQDPDIFNAITIASNHALISMIITSQNYFVQGKYSKTLLRNCSEKVLFRDRSDRQVLHTLSRQMFPGHPNFLGLAMDWVVEHFKDHWNYYLYIDNNPRSLLNESYKVRANILSDEPVFFTLE